MKRRTFVKSAAAAAVLLPSTAMAHADAVTVTVDHEAGCPRRVRIMSPWEETHLSAPPKVGDILDLPQLGHVRVLEVERHPTRWPSDSGRRFDGDYRVTVEGREFTDSSALRDYENEMGGVWFTHCYLSRARYTREGGVGVHDSTRRVYAGALAGGRLHHLA